MHLDSPVSLVLHTFRGPNDTFQIEGHTSQDSRRHLPISGQNHDRTRKRIVSVHHLDMRFTVVFLPEKSVIKGV